MKTYAEYRDMVEAALPSMLDQLGSVPEKLKEAMAYSLLAGGKRLRPVLLLAACDACGGSLEAAMPYACALEMIHTYSLIHDDLPAMDNDEYRRGRLTNHKVFGEGMAILAGDGLLHGAMELMLRSAVKSDDMRGVRAAEVIARRSGDTGMVAGQVMDVTGEGTEPTRDSVRYIHLHKTADLITASVEAGMQVAGAGKLQLAAGIRYGQQLGLAFQIVDDLLDVIGDADVMGKQTGMDAAAGKQTWVALRGVDGAREDAAACVEMAEQCAQTMCAEPSFFIELARETLNRVN